MKYQAVNSCFSEPANGCIQIPWDSFTQLQVKHDSVLEASFGEKCYPPGNIFLTPSQGTFEDDFPFPEVGYVSSLEGIKIWSASFFHGTSHKGCQLERDAN